MLHSGISERKYCQISDINDGLKYKRLFENNISEYVNKLGHNQRSRMDKVIFDFVKESAEQGCISFSKSESAKIIEDLRRWMYKNYYETVDRETFRTIIHDIYKILPNLFPDCDPILLLALMIDNDIREYCNLFLNSIEISPLDVRYHGYIEVLAYINKERNIDIFSTDLSWARK